MSAKKYKFEMNDDQKLLFNKLSPLQQKVCIESLKGKSNIDSYRDGGGKAKGIKSQEASASELLSNLKVDKFLCSMRSVAVSKAVMTRQEMLERLSSIARANMSDLIEWRTQMHEGNDGEEVEQSAWAIKESAYINGVTMASIAEVTAGKEGFKIKQHSPLTAMKQLADVAGYNDAKKVEIDVNPISDLLKEISGNTIEPK